MSRAGWLLFLVALPAFAQVPPGVSIDPAQLDQLQRAPTRAPRASPPVPQASTPSVNPDALFGLLPNDSPPVVTLNDAIARASVHNFDLRIARERVIQQEAQVRRAWAALLPNASISAGYTFNCIIGQQSGPIDCGDQTVQFTSPEQLDQQALLFGSLGDLFSQAADLEQDPDNAAELRQNADALLQAEDDINAAKDNLEPVVVQPSQLLSGRANITWQFFNGRSIPLLMNAQKSVDAVELATEQTRRALALAVARGYYSAVTAKELVRISAERLSLSARHLVATKARVELNTETRLSLQRAELDVIRGQQSVRSAQAAFDNARGALGSLMGVDTMFDVVQPAPLDDQGISSARTAVAPRPRAPIARGPRRAKDRTADRGQPTTRRMGDVSALVRTHRLSERDVECVGLCERAHHRSAHYLSDIAAVRRRGTVCRAQGVLVEDSRGAT